MRAHLVPVVGLSVALAFGGSAHASARAPVSALPLAPAPTGVKGALAPPGLSARAPSAEHSYWQLSAAKDAGYCVVSREGGFRLNESLIWVPTENAELWHLVTTTEQRATLERVRFEVDGDTQKLRVVARDALELGLAAHAAGNDLAVWGFRERNGDVTLLARGATGGRETQGLRKENDESFQFASSECAFGAVRIAGKRAVAGAIAQLRGRLPPPPSEDGKTKSGPKTEGPEFIIDASVTKLARDAEPVLAVAVRVGPRGRELGGDR